MGKLKDAIRRWLKAEKEPQEQPVPTPVAPEIAEPAEDPVAKLEAQIAQLHQAAQNAQDSAEALALLLEQSLNKDQINVFAFDRESGRRVLGLRASQDVAQAILGPNETLAQALARCCTLSYTLLNIRGEQRCYKVREHIGPQTRLYTVRDVTQLQQIQNQQREALSQDSLTGLPNWETFAARANTMLTGPSPVASALVIQLQLLPEAGLPVVQEPSVPGGFLRACGAKLADFAPNALFARKDGTLWGLLHDGDEDTYNTQLQQLLALFDRQALDLPPAGIRTHRVLLGTAQYPEHGTALPDLMERARLAAYETGRKGGAGICPFQGIKLYRNLLLNKQSLFRELMENDRVAYLLQPVVRTTNAKIEAYQLVMASRQPGLEKMDQVLELARYAGCLNALEKRLWFSGMTMAAKLISAGQMLYNTKILLPSLPGACLTDRESQEFEEKFFDHLKHLVVEVNDHRADYALFATVKERRAAQWGASVATGCKGWDRENRVALDSVKQKIIRAEASLVKGIAQNEKKQMAFANLKAYAEENKCQLLASGIENGDDLHSVIILGADLLQGDYLCKAETYPAPVPERRIREIGQVQYGKRGK